MPEWLTIEVFDGVFPASQWRRAHDDDLVEAAVTHGAVYWEWHETRWGVVLELAFEDDERLERFRGVPAVRAALDAVPDRDAGLVIYRGRGGGAGSRVPRNPRLLPLAGSAELPVDEPDRYVCLGSDPESAVLLGGC